MSKEESTRRYLPNEVIGVEEGKLVFAGDMGGNIKRDINRKLIESGQGDPQVRPLKSHSPVENNRIKHPETPTRKNKRVKK